MRVFVNAILKSGPSQKIANFCGSYRPFRCDMSQARAATQKGEDQYTHAPRPRKG